MNTNLETLTNPELVKLYNETANVLRVEPVKRFSSKSAGVRRVREILGQVPTPKPVDTNAPRKGSTRRMHFTYPFNGHERLKAIRDPQSLRGRAFAKLEQGATFADIVRVVKKFDADRGSSPGHVERRAYEVIRLLHHYVGYGLREEGGKIYVHTKTPAELKAERGA